MLIKWGELTHNNVHNLQHDGVVMELHEGNNAANILRTEQALTQVVTEALGYKQSVVHKPHDT